MKKFLITFVLVIAFIGKSFADEGMWLPLLLGQQVYDEMVKKGLKLTKEQQDKIAAAGRAAQQETQAIMQGAGGFQNLTDDDRKKMDEIRKANDAKLLAVLSADQQKKFEDMKGKPFAMPEGAGRGGPGAPGGNRGRGNRAGNNN